MRTLVVFYSMEGNTAYAAERIAEMLGADRLRIHPKKEIPSKGPLKFLWGGKSALMAETPDLEYYDTDIDAYDGIIIGTPVWAATIAPPIRSFLGRHDLSGKHVAAFVCQAGNGGEKALAKLKECAGVAALEDECILIDPLAQPSDDTKAKIEDFCSRLRAAGF